MNEQIKKTAAKVLILLDGLSFRDARWVLRYCEERLQVNSFVVGRNRALAEFLREPTSKAEQMPPE